MLQQIFKYKLIPYTLFAAIISQSAISHGVFRIDVPGDQQVNGRPGVPIYWSPLPPGRVYINQNGERVFISDSEIEWNRINAAERSRAARAAEELEEREERQRQADDEAHRRAVMADPRVQERLWRLNQAIEAERAERQFAIELQNGVAASQFAREQRALAEREQRETQREERRFNNGEEVLGLIRDLLPSNERLFRFYLWYQGYVPKHGVRELGMNAPDDMINAAIKQNLRHYSIDAADGDEHRKRFIANLFLYVRLEQYFHDKAVKAGLEGEDVERLVTYALLDNDRRAKLDQTGYSGRIREVGPQQYTHADERSIEEIRSQILGLSDYQISRSGVPPLRMDRYIQKHIKNMCSSLFASN